MAATPSVAATPQPILGGRGAGGAAAGPSGSGAAGGGGVVAGAEYTGLAGGPAIDALVKAGIIKAADIDDSKWQNLPAEEAAKLLVTAGLNPAQARLLVAPHRLVRLCVVLHRLVRLCVVLHRLVRLFVAPFAALQFWWTGMGLVHVGQYLAASSEKVELVAIKQLKAGNAAIKELMNVPFPRPKCRWSCYSAAWCFSH